MNNFLYTDIWFSEDVRLASSENCIELGLSKFGIVVDDMINGITIKDGFVKVDPSMGKLINRTFIKSLPGRHLVETFTTFCYENSLTLNEKEFKEFQFEIFRILIGNGIISSCAPSSMVKAYKALKRNGIRALLSAVASGESKNIRAWKCLTCKRFRAENDGTCFCKGYRFSLPDNLTAIEIANLYPDAQTEGGVMYSAFIPKAKKSCGVAKPRVKTTLTRSVIYELDDQLDIKRKCMNIDIK